MQNLNQYRSSSWNQANNWWRSFTLWPSPRKGNGKSQSWKDWL